MTQTNNVSRAPRWSKRVGILAHDRLLSVAERALLVKLPVAGPTNARLSGKKSQAHYTTLNGPLTVILQKQVFHFHVKEHRRGCFWAEPEKNLFCFTAAQRRANMTAFELRGAVIRQFCLFEKTLHEHVGELIRA